MTPDVCCCDDEDDVVVDVDRAGADVNEPAGCAENDRNVVPAYTKFDPCPSIDTLIRGNG